MTEDNFRKARNIKDGYARGVRMQWGPMRHEALVDPFYIEAMKLAHERSVVSEDNRRNIFVILRDYLSKISPGNIIEFGSYKGGNALFMAYVVKRLCPSEGFS
jgi:hypothetical protein